MNGIECFFYCIQETGFLYPLIGLIIIIFLSLFIYYKKRIYESLLTSQVTMTIVIFFNLFFMNCNMFFWLWIYLGIILIGILSLGVVGIYLNMKLDRYSFKLPRFLTEIEQFWNVEIRVLDTQRVKAFTYKNKIYLSVGLLERLEKDEIKSVVAHEVYHLHHSPNKFLSSLLALTSMTFHRFNDQHLADRYAVKTIGFLYLVNAFKKLQIKDADVRIRKLSSIAKD